MADNPFEERAEPNPFQVRDDAAPAPSLSAFLRSWSKLFLLLPERVDRVMSPRTGCPARTRSARLLACLTLAASVPSHTLTCPRSLSTRCSRTRA